MSITNNSMENVFIGFPYVVFIIYGKKYKFLNLFIFHFLWVHYYLIEVGSVQNMLTDRFKQMLFTNVYILKMKIRSYD